MVQLYPYEVHIQHSVVGRRGPNERQTTDSSMATGGAVSTPQIQPISCPHSMSIPRLALACPGTMSATGEHVPGSRCQCSTQLQELDCRCAAELGRHTHPPQAAHAHRGVSVSVSFVFVVVFVLVANKNTTNK